MGWDQVEERKAGAGAGFLALKDGDARKIHIIDDEPHTFSSVFFNALKKSAVVDPDNSPVKGVKGFDVRTRHAINVFDYDDKKVKVMAGSNELFNQLKGIYKEWGGFDSVDLRISRTGSGFDTKYQVVPTPKCMWNPAYLKGQELHDLATVFAPTPDEVVTQYMEGVDPTTEFDSSKMEAEATTEEELPVDDAVVDEEVPMEVPMEEPEVEAPAPKPKPAPAKLAPRPAPVKALTRNELIMKLNAATKTKIRYKKPGVWSADVKKFGGADKTSMSQLGQEALQKLLNFVNTVK